MVYMAEAVGTEREVVDWIRVYGFGIFVLELRCLSPSLVGLF